jgi:hypothetical protein
MFDRKMRRRIAVFCFLFSLLGSTNSDADESELKSVRLAFFDRHTIEVPPGWRRVEDSKTYQIVSADGELVFTATEYEATKDGWNTFWKTRFKADFPSLKSSGKVEIISHKQKDYRKNPLSILCRYEGRVEGSEIVYYTVSINCGDFFVSGNFVGDSKSLPSNTNLPASILRSIKPKAVGKADSGQPAARSESKPGSDEKPKRESEGCSR